MKTRAPLRAARQRAITVMGGVLLCLVIAVTAPAAPPPSYGDWSAPVSLGPIVNTAAGENAPALSDDGLSLYFFSGTPGAEDIWVTRRVSPSAPWGPPVKLGAPINTAAAETVPALSPDGHWMFFASTRVVPGALGLADIYQSYREDVHDDLAWQAPTNLGPGVNSPADDNASSYFENNGAPQLIFGSGRLGGAARDLFVSNRLADGTWGPATLIEELSGPATENRPSVRRDGLEIVFYSNRDGSAGAPPGNDLWAATRAAITDRWSAPVNLGATVNSVSSDVHPYLSADGRTLFFSSQRPGGLGITDIYVTTRSAKLTVTASDQARLFGQANAALTYGLSGFVGGDTASVVSGTAACSTTATQASPAGDYPITCTVGTLSAPEYVFASFVASTLTVAYSKPCSTGPSAGPLRVAAGEAVCVAGSQTGPVTVAPGGALDVEGGPITGPVVANGAAAVRICGATITGPLTVTGSTGPVLVGGAGCAPNTVIGPVRVTDNTGGAEVNGNTVVGPLRVTGNAAPVHAAGNTVTGPAAIEQ
jgi:hypothetical protein